MAVSYDAQYFQNQLNKSDAKVAFQYGRLLQHIANVAPDARILDAGCGAGPALRYLKQRGFIPFGTDLIEYPLMQARQLLPDARLAQCDSDVALPFAENSFDVILLSEVIEHVASPEFTLRECRRVLRGGGGSCGNDAEFVGRAPRLFSRVGQSVVGRRGRDASNVVQSANAENGF